MNTQRVFWISVLAITILFWSTGITEAYVVFGKAVNLGPVVNGSVHDAAAWITPDELSLYFWRGATWADVGEAWLATRATKQDPWGSPVSLGAWDETIIFKSVKTWPGFTTADGLEAYFSDWILTQPRPGGYGSLDLWMMKRTTIDAAWGSPINLGAVVNSSDLDWSSSISPDGLELYFSSNRPGGQGTSDLWVAKRAARNGDWGAPVNLGALVNSASWDSRPWLSADGLTLFFDSDRGGGYGQGDLYVTKRATLASLWGAPMNLGRGVNSPAYEECAFVSADGSTLYFDVQRPGGPGGADIWQAAVQPLVDFNHDGKVDEEDKAILTAYRGQNEPSVDIGPMPWGDGIVDDADLDVLMSHWGQDVNDPTLAAHWRLDETEGDIAHDSEGDNHGSLYGGAVWQPSNGKIGGALQLDGVDDYVGTGFVLDPGQGPFSVYVWVKGGAPGQAILSQATAQRIGTAWLGTDPIDGKLMTTVMSPMPPLTSGTIITDNQWHRVGLTWDGAFRRLSVDGQTVAKDQALITSTSRDGGLRIGAGSNLEPTAFWSGLIDDVRIVDPAKPYKFVIQRDTTGFQIYADHNTPDMFDYYWLNQGTIDLASQTSPAKGSSCIYATGIALYDGMGFDFWPRDMTQLVQEGYVLEFWVRGDSPGTAFDVWFEDTKTSDPEDHPWRMLAQVTESFAKWDNQWHLVRIPLTHFSQGGSWDNNTWFSSQGKFDWAAVHTFIIAAQRGDWVGKEFWFDEIRVTK